MLFSSGHPEEIAFYCLSPHRAHKMRFQLIWSLIRSLFFRFNLNFWVSGSSSNKTSLTENFTFSNEIKRSYFSGCLIIWPNYQVCVYFFIHTGLDGDVNDVIYPAYFQKSFYTSTFQMPLKFKHRLDKRIGKTEAYHSYF